MNRHRINTRRSRLALAAILAALVTAPTAWTVNEALINREPDGGRSGAVHRINALDINGEKISPDDLLPLPMSTKQTCGECHNYDKISAGFHFDAASTASVAGRKGEPFMLVNRYVGAQLPVSPRGWEGAWTPEEIGLTPWRFTKAFGSHMPGGGMGEIGEEFAPGARWHISGQLEINCLMCHSASPEQDQNAWATHVRKENFQWAATASSGLGFVAGNASKLANSYSIYDGPDPRLDVQDAPSIQYNATAFNPKNEVFFDIEGKPDNKRCYSCHSSKLAENGVCETDEDIHVAAGMSCVDCHRNNIGHEIVRGYDSESEEREGHSISTLSCEGCHLGAGDEPEELAGRLGAPVPEHKGLPPIHFDKMTCTSCHSGPWVKDEAQLTRTSRAHRMGVHAGAPSEIPYIVTPVFQTQEDGKLAPMNMVWPAYWGRKGADGGITPILPDTVFEDVGEILIGWDQGTTGTELAFTEWKVSKALAAYKEKGEDVVYVSSGLVHSLGEEGKLASVEGASEAAPYSWPVGHTVRGAGASLGARGCEDCHSKDADFYAGTVTAVGPLKDVGPVVSTTMAELHNMSDEKVHKVHAIVAQCFKWLIIITMAFLIAHIIADLLRRTIMRPKAG